MAESDKQPVSFKAWYFIGAGIAGVFVNKLLPVDWLVYAFTGAIGVTLLTGILASIGSEEREPVSRPLKVLSYLAVGTSEPNAVVPRSVTLNVFLLCAIFVAGMTAGILFVP
jgi:hypothetical protein